MVPVARSTSFLGLSTILAQRLAHSYVICRINCAFGRDRHRIHSRHLILKLLLELLLLLLCFSCCLLCSLLPCKLLIFLPLESSFFYCLYLLNLPGILILHSGLLLHLLDLSLISDHLLDVIVSWWLCFFNAGLMVCHVHRVLSLHTQTSLPLELVSTVIIIFRTRRWKTSELSFSICKGLFL